MVAEGREQRAGSRERRAGGREQGARQGRTKINHKKPINMEYFRFENMDIWKQAIEISDRLFDYADVAEQKRCFRFAEQLRAASMSISNNIAEGSGSFSDKEFASFLNISRRSLFECVNILHIFHRRNIISTEEKMVMKQKLLILSKKITNFRKSLK